MATHVVLAGSVQAAVSRGALVPWRPSRPVAAEAARLFLTPDVRTRMAPASDGRDPLRAMASAAFDQFVELGTAVHNLFENSWGRLGVAQLKVMAPKPGARLIGGFVDPLLYLGVRLYWRDELDFKPAGQVGLIDYKTLGQAVAADWDAIAPGVARRNMKDF